MHIPDELQEHAARIRSADGDTIKARWETGRCLISLREGKQLPDGILPKYAKALGFHRSEVSAWMTFAEKYPSEADLSTVVESCRTWHRIKQTLYTPRPKAAKQSPTTQAARLVARFKEIDPIELTPELLNEIKETIHRHEQSLATLAMRRPA